MMILWLAVICYSLPLFLLIIIGRRILFSKLRTTSHSKKQALNLTELTVIVPLRNEEVNIKLLVSCIEQSTRLPYEIIFVDDHSTDNSYQYLNEFIKGRSSFKMIQLGAHHLGKKHAVRSGILEAKTEFVLMLDADVVFDTDFFENLSTLKKHDLIILPVKMFHKKWYQHFFIIDVYIANAVNEGISGLLRPVMASGANLVCHRGKFLSWDSQRNFDFLGGDDLHILKDFRNNNGVVAIEIDSKFSVLTEAPDTFKAFFSQRLRWSKNAMHVRDHLSSFLVMLQLFFTFSIFIFLCYFLVNSYVKEAVLLGSFKILFDLLLFYSFFKNKNQLLTLSLLPIYELVFPIYILILCFGVLFINPFWKNRKVQPS
jgi:cellulose synthase/poly-beta-1,6-N-acetylglucosamine synthase-like glycosyltransferase